MSSGATGLAGRYAGALYALAVDSNKVDVISGDLDSLAVLLVYSQDLKNLLPTEISTPEISTVLPPKSW